MVFFILKPFFSAILASLILAYIFNPVYKFVKKVFRNKTLSSLIVSILIVLLFTVPLFFIANAVSNEARVNYVFIKKILATGNILDDPCDEPGFICTVRGYFEEYLSDPQIKFQLTNITSKLTDFFINAASNFIFSIPSFLISFFVMVFIIFYLFKDGETIALRIKNLLPLKTSHRKGIFDQLNEVTFAVLYGHVLVAAIQAILGVIAFWIFGVTSPILWGLVMFFFAMIPFLGTPIVWVPAVIVKAFANQPWQALGLLVAGLFISTIDNVIKPKLVSDKAKVHPVVILLGVIGGIFVFGPIGIIIGPVVLSIFMKFIEIYEEEQLEA
jgi:predicted PurR-regulated permease PerM